MSLLLHLAVAAVTWRIPLNPEVDRALADDRDREVELFLVPDEAAGDPDPQMPQAFTAVPDRQASETPPEQPDYLALHHSLAADNKLGGDSSTPSADEEWVADQVRIEKEELAGAEGVAYAEQPLPETVAAVSDQAAGAEGEASETVDGKALDPAGDWALPQDAAAGGKDQGEQTDKQDEKKPELDEWWGGEAPSILKEGDRGAVGDRGFDFNQAARGKVQAGVAFNGDYSLNTYEWDYAPWMTRFQNELYRHWMAPYAYRIGVISGMTVIKLVIRKDGRVESMEVIQTEGHQSLHDASEAALKAFAPYWPLPDHFPEENLVITLGLHYPAFRR